MSLLHCDGCQCLIVTDNEPEAYSEAQDKWFCTACRPKRLEAEVRQLSEETQRNLLMAGMDAAQNKRGWFR